MQTTETLNSIKNINKEGEMNDAFGPHLTLDLSGCAREKLTSLKLVYDILDELPSTMGMTKLIPPFCMEYKEGKVPEDWGVTGFVVIAESHISIHTFPEKNYVFIDMFSCKTFDVERAMKYLREIFKPQKATINLVHRGLDFPRGEKEQRAEPPVIEEIPEFGESELSQPEYPYH